MTPDELQARSHERALVGCFESPCTTCEGEGAILTIGAWMAGALDEWTQNWVRRWRAAGDASGDYDWQVDTCPECGRGREVGRL